MRINSGNKEPRVVTAAEAARVVRSGDWLDYGTTLIQPDLFDEASARLALSSDHPVYSALLIIR
jgi:hypothetical protein